MYTYCQVHPVLSPFVEAVETVSLGGAESVIEPRTGSDRIPHLAHSHLGKMLAWVGPELVRT
jgi:hypothetical protein